MRDLPAEQPVRDARIAYADALRTFAILSVVVCHLIGILPHASAGIADELENVGGWGVGCFFVLTGFLLGRPYLESIVTPERRAFPSTRLFFARRFYRIFPLYAFAVIATGLAELLHDRASVTPLNVAVHLGFLQGFIPAYDGAPFGPLWTMAVDAQFYVLLPFAALALYAILRRRTARARLAGVLVVLSASFVGSIAWRYAMAIDHPIVFANFETALVYVRNVIGMGASFAMGVGLALFSILNVKTSRSAAALSLALGMFLAGLFCYMNVRGNPFITMVWGDSIAGLSAVLILWGCIEGRFSRLARIAGAPLTTALAALSYAVYLFHKPVMVGVHDVLAKHGHGSTSGDVVLLVLLSATLIGLVAVVAHHVVERPFLRARDRSRPVPPSEQPPARRVEPVPILGPVRSRSSGVVTEGGDVRGTLVS